MYEAVIFDMDGVIIDSKEHVETFWNRKLEQYNIDPPAENRELRFHGRPARPTVNDLFAELPEETREKIITECAEYDASVTNYKMIAGAENFIKRCFDADIRIGLVTSALPGKVDRMLEGLSYPSPFEVMVTADQVKAGKPDPECYQKAADKLNINPEKMVVFEDSIAGVKAAAGAGATVVGINEPKMESLLKQAGATVIIPNFEHASIPSTDGAIHIKVKSSDEEAQFTIRAKN